MFTRNVRVTGHAIQSMELSNALCFERLQFTYVFAMHQTQASELCLFYVAVIWFHANCHVLVMAMKLLGTVTFLRMYRIKVQSAYLSRPTLYVSL
jgi:hypothetical protein